MEDTELLHKWRAGDEAAASELLRRYFDSVCRFFRSKLGDDVDDLIQRTFLDVVESQPRIVPASFRAYLFGIARNRLFDHLRAKCKRPPALDIADISEMSLVQLGTTPSQKAARNQREQLLLSALSHLPLDQRIILELSYWEGLDGAEIAAALSINPNTVRSRLSRARDALRKQLADLTTTWDMPTQSDAQQAP